MPESHVPSLSVVMTVYNGERYLAEAIESILNQSFRDFEFIIVDDGSTDSSAVILHQFALKDERIRLINQSNAGIVNAVNSGVRRARAQYLARMDCDDRSMPERFDRQVRYLDEHPDCVLVGSRVMIMDPYGSPVSETAHGLTHEQIDAELLTVRGGWALVQPSVMMRTDAFRKVGGYRGRHNVSEDHDLFVRLAEIGNVANLPEPLVWYRRHYKSVTHTLYEQQREVKEKILREAFERRNLPWPADWKFEPWRPPDLSKQLRLWGWAALKAKNIRIARKHAFASLRHSPTSQETWRLLFCALRGH